MLGIFSAVRARTLNAMTGTRWQSGLERAEEATVATNRAVRRSLRRRLVVAWAVIRINVIVTTTTGRAVVAVASGSGSTIVSSSRRVDRDGPCEAWSRRCWPAPVGLNSRISTRCALLLEDRPNRSDVLMRLNFFTSSLAFDVSSAGEKNVTCSVPGRQRVCR